MALPSPISLPYGWPQGVLIVIFAWVLASCTSADKESFDAGAAAQRVNALRALEDELKMEVFLQVGHSQGLRSVAISPDGRWVLSGSFDRSIKHWDMIREQVLPSFPRDVHGNPVLASEELLPGATWSNEVMGLRAESPAGDLVVTEPVNRSVWKRGALVVTNRDGKTIHTLETHQAPSTGSTNTLMFSRDGRYFAWADSDLMGTGLAKVWEVASWRLLGTYSASVVNFSRDSRTLVLGRPSGGSPYLKELASGEETVLGNGGPSAVTDLAVASDGRSVVAGMHDGSAIRWDLTLGQSVQIFECPKDQSVLSVAVNPIKPLAVTVCTDGSVWLWEMMTGKLVRNVAKSLPDTFYRAAVHFSTDGHMLVWGAGEQLGVWNVSEGKEVRRDTLPRETLPIWTEDISVDLIDKLYRIRSIALHPNGQSVAIATGLGVRLWDAKNGRLVRKLSDEAVGKLAFLPDGHILQTIVHGTVLQWSVAAGQEFPSTATPTPSTKTSRYREFQPIEERLKIETIIFDRERGIFTFSHDGRFIARSAENFLKVYNMASDAPLHELKGHQDVITTLAFASHRRLLVSGSTDGTVRIWDLQSGKEVAALISLGGGESVTITPDHYYRASKTPVKGVSFQMGDKLLPFEQFAEKLNKPDIVQQRLTEVFSNFSQK